MIWILLGLNFLAFFLFWLLLSVGKKVLDASCLFHAWARDVSLVGN